MHPLLLKCGFISIYSYGAMIVMAFFVATYLAQRAAKRSGVSADIITNSALLVLFSGIVGARILYVLLDLEFYAQNPIEIFMLPHGGLAFYGGAIAAIAAELIYLKLKKLSVYEIGDLIIPYVALGQAIGRLGCFLNGCCYGKPTDSFFGVTFPGEAHAVYPTQIFSSVLLIFLYGFLRLLQKLNVRPGIVLISYGLLYSAGRFLMEFLRGDNMAIVLGLTFSQFVGVVVFLFCAILLLIRLSQTHGRDTN